MVAMLSGASDESGSTPIYARRLASYYTTDKRLVGSSLRSVANQLFLSSSSQQQRYSLMAVKNHRATQQAC